MSMESSRNRGTFCLTCSAVGDPGAAYCWMCGSSELRTLGPVAPAGSPAPAAQKDPAVWHLDDEIGRPATPSMPRFIKPLVSMLGLFLAAGFLVGLWQESPGLAIILALVIPLVVAVLLGLMSSGESGAPSNRGASVGGSILRVLGVVSTLAVVAIVGVVAWVIFTINTCLAACGGHR